MVSLPRPRPAHFQAGHRLDRPAAQHTRVFSADDFAVTCHVNVVCFCSTSKKRTSKDKTSLHKNEVLFCDKMKSACAKKLPTIHITPARVLLTLRVLKISVNWRSFSCDTVKLLARALRMVHLPHYHRCIRSINSLFYLRAPFEWSINPQLLNQPATERRLTELCEQNLPKLGETEGNRKYDNRKMLL